MPRLPPGTGSLFGPRTKRRLAWAMLGSVVAALAEVAGVALVYPLIQLMTTQDLSAGVASFVANMLGTSSQQLVAYVLAGLILVAFMAKSAFNIVFRWWLIRFVNAEAVRTGELLVERYLRAPYWVHLRRNSSEMMRTLLDGVDQTYSLVVIGALGGMGELAVVIALTAALLVVMPIPAVLALIYFALAGFTIDRLIRTRAVRAGTVLTSSVQEVYQAALQALGGVKEIKVRQRTDHFVESYRQARLRLAAGRSSQSFLIELPRYLLEVVFVIGAAIVVAAVYALESGPTAFSLVAVFIAAGFRLLPSLTRLVAAASSIRIGRAGLDLVLAELREDLPQDAVGDRDEPPLGLTREIRFDGIGFRYPGTSVEVLMEVDLTVARGTSVALVGPSGAGKSTLVDLLLGLHRPTTGRVLVDDVDVLGPLVPRWQRALGLVPQDVFLLDDTLRANIALGESESELDHERVTEAVQRAQLSDLVGSLPGGLDTVVGERGVRFSGGQRQRIGIARALYLRPEVLVLDEATSALDNATERRITETITALHGSMTIVIVAHRLSTVRQCDSVVYLEAGSVRAVGPFEDVRRTDRGFERLVELASLEAAGSGG